MAGLDSFAVSVQKEQEGVWETIGDMEFLIARAGNKEWKKLQRKLELATFGNDRKKTRDSEKEVDILVKCLAHTGVLDWKNVSLGGKEIKYSKEKCHEILSDDRFKLLTEELLEVSLNQERFKEENIVEDEKK